MKYSGFSFIELIITIAIIGILTGIVAPTFGSYQKKRKLIFSSDLLETALQKSFSNSRSEPRIFGVKGYKEGKGYTLFSCAYILDPKTQTPLQCEEEDDLDYTETNLSFESGIVNKKSFFIQFLPPHGDIDTVHSRIAGISLGTENILIVQHARTQQEKNLRLYMNSGLIEKYTP